MVNKNAWIAPKETPHFRIENDILEGYSNHGWVRCVACSLTNTIPRSSRERNESIRMAISAILRQKSAGIELFRVGKMSLVTVDVE